jgi:hypothetical protein
MDSAALKRAGTDLSLITGIETTMALTLNKTRTKASICSADKNGRLMI